MLKKNKFYENEGMKILYLGEVPFGEYEKKAEFLFMGKVNGEEYASIVHLPLNKIVEEEKGKLSLISEQTSGSQHWVHDETTIGEYKKIWNNALEKSLEESN